MKRYKLALKAVEEMEKIFDYLAANSPQAAKTVIDKFFSAMQSLGKNPSLGHDRPDLTDRPFKFYSVFAYLVVYDAAVRPIRILHVIHGNRDVKRILASD